MLHKTHFIAVNVISVPVTILRPSYFSNYAPKKTKTKTLLSTNHVRYVDLLFRSFPPICDLFFIKLHPFWERLLTGCLVKKGLRSICKNPTTVLLSPAYLITVMWALRSREKTSSKLLVVEPEEARWIEKHAASVESPVRAQMS